MRRIVLLFLSFCLIFLFEFQPVSAFEEGGNTSSFAELSDAAGGEALQEAVPQSARKFMERAGIKDLSAQSLLTEPKTFLKMIWDELRYQAAAPIRSFAMILGTLLLCSLLDCLRETFVEEGLKQVFSCAVVLFLTISVLLPASDCIRTCVEDLRACAEFMSVFAPVYASVVTVSGMPVTGNLYHVLVFSAAQVISALVSAWLMPLSGVYLALSIAGALSPQLQLTPLLSSLKSTICWALGFLLAGFVTLLTMQSTVSSGMDALTLKTSKMLISSFVPIVGGALSDAVSTASGYLRLLRSVFGVYGIAAAACIFLPTLLRTGVWYLTMNIGAAIGEMLSVKEGAGLLKAGASLMSILLAVQFLYLLLILVSTTMLLFAGGGSI